MWEKTFITSTLFLKEFFCILNEWIWWAGLWWLSMCWLVIWSGAGWSSPGTLGAVLSESSFLHMSSERKVTRIYADGDSSARSAHLTHRNTQIEELSGIQCVCTGLAKFVRIKYSQLLQPTHFTGSHLIKRFINRLPECVQTRSMCVSVQSMCVCLTSPFIPLPSSWKVLRVLLWSSVCSLPDDATLLCGDRGACSAPVSPWHPLPSSWFSQSELQTGWLAGVSDMEGFSGLGCTCSPVEPALAPLLTGVPGKATCPFCPAGELHVDGRFSCQPYDGSRDSAEPGHSSDPCRACWYGPDGGGRDDRCSSRWLSHMAREFRSSMVVAGWMRA